jgi:chorismate mutase
MTDKQDETDIALLRARIDEIDAEIAHLLVRRTEIAQKVAFSKIQDAKLANIELGFGWRPKREVEIIREILRREPTLGRRLSYMVWRAMITRNLANQAPMEVVCVEESNAPSRIGFGAAVVPQIVTDAISAINIASEKENMILSLPYPDMAQDWWRNLLLPQFRAIKINMALPHIEDVPAEALCLAKITPLETGNDYSLIAAPHGSSLNGKVISKSPTHALWLLKGFHENLADEVTGIYFLGAYAIA